MNSDQNLSRFMALIQTIEKLRNPGGCPWDAAQTHQSLKKYLIEEAYEVAELIDQIQGPLETQSKEIQESFQEELGDLLLQILLHSKIASESKIFHFFDVAHGLNEKMIRRHPHVFGDTPVQTSTEALQIWEKQKEKEKKPDQLWSLPLELPALQRTTRIFSRLKSIHQTLSSPHRPAWEHFHAALQTQLKNNQEDLLGTLLLQICAVSVQHDLEPEEALKKALKKLQTQMTSHSTTQIWGLTGGVAAGKSTASQIFEKQGIPVIQADQITKEIYAKNTVVCAEIQRIFGTLQFHELREIIFKDSHKKTILESILHPLIEAESRQRITELSQDHALIIYESPLLLETHRFIEFTGILTLLVPESIRLQRLLTRPHMTEGLAQQIISSQITDTERLQKSNFYFENHSTLAVLETQILNWIQTVTTPIAKPER